MVEYAQHVGVSGVNTGEKQKEEQEEKRKQRTAGYSKGGVRDVGWCILQY